VKFVNACGFSAVELTFDDFVITQFFVTASTAVALLYVSDFSALIHVDA